MKYFTALVATCAAASASKIEAKSAIESKVDASANPNPYDQYNYFNHPGYVAPSYEHEYGEVLPGADFNKQVYNFNEAHQIWDQNDYEERVKVEAEMLVALEALKESIMYLSYDVHEIDERIHAQYQKIGFNHQDAFTNM